MYIYPDNLKSKAVLWLWELRDIAIIGVGALISLCLPWPNLASCPQW